ncbi:MAG: DUF2442 domain-containing protein [Dehalococcoidia bacterium]
MSALDDAGDELVGRPYPKEITVTGVRYLQEFVIEVSFADGFIREVNLAAEVTRGGVFQPLADVEFFRQVTFDQDGRTAAWPNGVDLAPEFLRWGPHLPKGCPCGYDDPE